MLYQIVLLSLDFIDFQVVYLVPAVGSYFFRREMPKVSRKRRFRGTPYWKCTQDFEEEITAHTSTETSGALPKESDDERDHSESCSSDNNPQDSVQTASERKLENATPSTSSVPYSDYGSAISYRLVELSSLMQTFEELHKCRGGKLVYNDEQAKRYGNSSLIHIECTKCKKKVHLQTSANPGGNWKAQSAVDINRRMVFSACEMGVGREAIAVMCEILNMPPPCQTKAWSDHSQALYKAHKDAVDEKLAKARAHVHELRRKENPDLNEDDDIEIAVSFDGTWSKRGFTANFGIGFVISADSGQVLDYGFASKICVQCSRKKQKLSEDSDEFRTWYAAHSPYCTENHTGSSGAMEKDIARRIWSNSLSYNLRYKFMICDGDSKAYNAVWDIYGSCDDCSKWENMAKTSNEYKKWVASDAHDKWKTDHDFGKADCPRVMKLDCIGHVQKRAGTALRELRKKTAGKLKDGLPVGGRKHRLTDSCIDKLQGYYGKAIRRNVKSGEISSDEAEKHIKAMQNDIMAVLYHSCNVSEKTRHQYCPSGKDSWCQFKRTGRFENKDHHLDPVFLELLEPVFKRLCEQSLLRRCLPGFSQNSNESINSLVWMRAPKHKYHGPQRVEMAAMGAVLQFNEGASGKHLVMEKAGIVHGELSLSGSAQKDQQRVKHSKLKASEKQRKARRKIRQGKKKAQEDLKSLEGTTYSSGRFNDINPLDSHSSSEDDIPLAQVARKKAKKTKTLRKK